MKQLQWMGKWERQRPQALGVGGRAQQQRGPRESKQEHVVRLGSWGVEGGEEGRRPGPRLDSEGQRASGGKLSGRQEMVFPGHDTKQH